MADKEDAVVDEAAARAWWAARELRAEAELSAVLQKRVEAQRAQTLAFKTEQSKWEHELQLRLAKYAHDRKLLTEHNVEMQEQLRALQEQLARQQREMDVQVMRVIELEATASDGRIDAQHAQSLQIRCESLEKVWQAVGYEQKRGSIDLTDPPLIGAASSAVGALVSVRAHCSGGTPTATAGRAAPVPRAGSSDEVGEASKHQYAALVAWVCLERFADSRAAQFAPHNELVGGFRAHHDQVERHQGTVKRAAHRRLGESVQAEGVYSGSTRHRVALTHGGGRVRRTKRSTR